MTQATTGYKERRAFHQWLLSRSLPSPQSDHIPFTKKDIAAVHSTIFHAPRCIHGQIYAVVSLAQPWTLTLLIITEQYSVRTLRPCILQSSMYFNCISSFVIPVMDIPLVIMISAKVVYSFPNDFLLCAISGFGTGTGVVVVVGGVWWWWVMWGGGVVWWCAAVCGWGRRFGVCGVGCVVWDGWGGVVWVGGVVW